jgi:hypothetical protein
MNGSTIHVKNSDIKGGLNIDEKYCLKLQVVIPQLERNTNLGMLPKWTFEDVFFLPLFHPPYLTFTPTL